MLSADYHGVGYLDLSNEFVVLVVLCVGEFVDFDFVLLNLLHYLTMDGKYWRKRSQQMVTLCFLM